VSVPDELVVTSDEQGTPKPGAGPFSVGLIFGETAVDASAVEAARGRRPNHAGHRCKTDYFHAEACEKS
jgi:hypothetical protein